VTAEATGFQRDLYEFPELPSPLSQFLEKEFFNYADRTASQALAMLLDGLPKHLWSSEMLSAWARFLIGLHTRHLNAQESEPGVASSTAGFAKFLARRSSGNSRRSSRGISATSIEATSPMSCRGSLTAY
jgi:hypothetical protein